MYVINSQLPGEITAIIDNSEKIKEVKVEGYGATEQLEVMSAPENKFGMSFRQALTFYIIIGICKQNTFGQLT